MPTIEGLLLKKNKVIRNTFVKYRRKRINCVNFSIISNNCWGGMIYESYGLLKQSPTCGLFFMAEDYINFLENLDKCLNVKLDFISPKESKYKDNPIVANDSRFGNYPIGILRLSDEINIEIFFLHYRSESEAYEKWTRRCQRVCWDKMIVKFNDQNGCTSELVDRFVRLDFESKIFFTVRNWEKQSEWEQKCNFYVFKQLGKNEHILTSYEPFGNNKKCNVNHLISKLQKE